MFRKMRGMRLPYRKQGLLYFICQNERDMPQDVRDRILALCLEAGGEDYGTLYEVLTSDKSIKRISTEQHISEPTIYRLREKFYKSWYNE